MSRYHICFVSVDLSAAFTFPVCVCALLRSSSLSAVNAMLREQLEQAGLANEALSQDIRRLTVDWTKAREELEQKESDWRREEEVGERRRRMSRTSDVICFIFTLFFISVLPQLLQQ